MDAWISLLSYFSGELLVFELLGVFTLLAAFFVFLFARKRRYPDSTVVVPAQVFHESIDQLINEAETLKAQIFGSGAPRLKTAPMQRAVHEQPVAGATPAAGGGDNSALLAELESLRTQLAALKAQNEALAKSPSAGAPTGGGNAASSDLVKDALKNAEALGASPELLQKIKALEERLEEYSVIEDDLANLKRLQQENAQLKAQLGGTPAPVAAAPAAVTTPAPSAPVAAAPAPVVAEPAPAAPVETPAAAAPVAAAPEAPAGASVNPNPAAPTEPAAAAAPVPSGGGDEDLLAEFEKILNS